MPRSGLQQALFWMGLALLAFIPLYPKIPLFEAIPGYLVRVRAEDVLVAAVGSYWLLLLLLGKIQWRTSYTVLMMVYATIGIISLLSSIFLSQSIPAQLLHIGKSGLHLGRYLEYFSLFIIWYGSVTDSTKQTKGAITVLSFIVLVSVIYGYGQKYLSWPVFSTMNREFSKGMGIALSESARVPATFGGHYDLAAYLLLVLPILLAVILFTKSWVARGVLAVISAGGLWLLLLTEARTALVALVLGVLLVSSYWFWLRFGLTKLAIVATGLLSLAIVGSGLLWWRVPSLSQKLTDRWQRLSAAPVVDPTSDLSPNAQRYGLSLGIRLDTLWPQAFKGFVVNPFLGQGYATLNKQGVHEFTEADSTDNNYLRVLGETGLTGFIVFFGLIALIWFTIARHLIQNANKFADWERALLLGFLGGTVALLVDALLIDVFAASKVAFTFWALAGLAIKILFLQVPAAAQLDLKRLKTWVNWCRHHWPILVAGTLLFLLAHKQPFSERSLVQSLELAPQAAQQIAASYCLATEGWNECFRAFPAMHLVSPYTWYLVPGYWLYRHPSMFYFSNLILSFVALVGIYQASQLLTTRKWLRLCVVLIYVTLPIVYRLPAQPVSLNLWLAIVAVLAPSLLKKFAFPLIAKHRLLLSSHKFSTTVATTLALYLITVGLATQVVKTVKANFRDTYQPTRYLAVRRVSTRVQANSVNEAIDPNQTHLITAINSDYVKLYSNGLFKTLPLAGGGELAQQYESIITSENTVLLSNADLDQRPELKLIFEELKQKYGIELIEIDCQFACNVYQLTPESKPLSQTPEMINAPLVRLQTTSQSSPSGELAFAVLSNRFDPSMNKPPYETKVATTEFSRFQKLDADLFFLLGDAVHEPESDVITYFLTHFGNTVSYPLVYIPGNYDIKTKKGFSSGFQAFQQGAAFFLIYDPGPENVIPYDQQLKIFNALLQLEKHPEITHLFVMTHRLQWLQQRSLQSLYALTAQDLPHDGDVFFTKQLLPALEKLTSKKITVIGGDLRPTDHPAVLYYQDPINKITYVASGWNHTDSDTYLMFTLNEKGEMVITVYDNQGKQLEPIGTYNSTYWNKLLPSISAPQ